MTTTAYDDQFAAEPDPVHQPYDVAAILRKNIADLEKELQRQKERAEKAEAELKAARINEDCLKCSNRGKTNGLAQESFCDSCIYQGRSWRVNHFSGFSANPQSPAVKYMGRRMSPDGTKECLGFDIGDELPKGTLLYARPISAPAVPAPEIPDGDDFNGTTPHLIQCIESLVRMNDCGVLVPHGIGGHARTLLLASANRLRQQPAPSVPKEWLKCWLIERPASSEWPAIWLTITTDGRRWVYDGGTMYATGGDWYFTSAASEALKFADKESADEYVRHNKIKDVVVTEHIFYARALLQSANHSVGVTEKDAAADRLLEGGK